MTSAAGSEQPVRRLPPREVVKPKAALRSSLRIVVPIGVVVFALLLLVAHNSAAALGGVIALGIVVVIAAIEVPLILRSQARRQDQRLAALPGGGLFAGRAEMLPPTGEQGLPRLGAIQVTEWGVTFVPRKATTEPVGYAWDQIRHVGLTPKPSGIGVGRLALTLVDGSSTVFTVPHYGPLAQKLHDHP